MTDAADDTADEIAPAGSTQEPTAVDHLTALQEIDTDADQLSHRRERLPERDALASATARLAAWEQQRDGLRTRLDELTQLIERTEVESGELAEHKARLEAQMKTVIAPREAEALMHEMATIDEQVDVCDTRELEALEEQSDIDDTLTSHLTNEESLRNSTSEADRILERATGEIDTELASLGERREEARGRLSSSILGRYDRVRASSGVAVAHLNGHLCTGCHLDLSAAEVDDVKDEAAASDGVADCPNCGRMLVL